MAFSCMRAVRQGHSFYPVHCHGAQADVGRYGVRKPVAACKWRASSGTSVRSVAHASSRRDVAAASGTHQAVLDVKTYVSNVESKPPNAATATTIQDLRGLLGSMYEEHEYWVQPEWVEGQIPPELCGTYFRNGPGLQVRSPQFERHVFDGDGMVLSISFKDGRAFFRNKYVRTRGFVQEQEAGRPLYRSAFTKGSADGSSFFNPFDFRTKNVANTGVLHWGGKLMALFENGLPHELDPKTLDTLGETDLGGAVKGGVLGAHYRVITQPDGSRRWVTFAVEAGAQCVVTFYEFDEQMRAVVPATRYSLPNSNVTLLHDMVVTPNYWILVEAPIRFDAGTFVSKYFLSQASLAECLVFDPKLPTRVHLVPRPGSPAAAASSAPLILTIPRPFFSFHHANAYELHGGSTVVVDTLGWDTVDFGQFSYSVFSENFTPDYYKNGSRMHLLRLVLDLEAGTTSVHRLARRTLEFPSVNPKATGQPHSHVFAGGDAVDDDEYWAPLQTVCKLSVSPTAGVHGPMDYERDVKLQAWFAGPRSYVMEPLFIPRAAGSGGGGGANSSSNGGNGGASDRSNGSAAAAAAGEDDGWLVTTLYDAETGKGQFAIFDAADVAAGPLARVSLPHFLPSGLHGSWSPTCFAPPEGPDSPSWRAAPGTPRRIRAL